MPDVIYQSVDGQLAYRRHHGLEPLRESKAKREVGFRVPEHERARWDNPVLGVMRVKPEQRKATPVQQLIVELEDWVLVNDDLERTIRAMYELAPTKVMVLVESTVEGSRAGRLRNPGGFLFKRLGEISSNGHH